MDDHQADSSEQKLITINVNIPTCVFWSAPSQMATVPEIPPAPICIAPTSPVAEPLSLGRAEEAIIIELAIITPLDRPTRNIGMASPVGELGAASYQIPISRREVSDAIAPTNVMISIR